MPKIRTLNELSHLRNSGYGQPWPRHGLKLLYWFANKYVDFDEDNAMCWRYDPERRWYGFHPFENRDDENVQLLPDTYLPYYEVGNLGKPRSNKLPKYVRRDYTGHHDDSNIDRVIVRVKDEHFDRVYVTEHCGESNYNPHGTYRISRGLIMLIQEYALDEFLKEMNV